MLETQKIYKNIKKCRWNEWKTINVINNQTSMNISNGLTIGQEEIIGLQNYKVTCKRSCTVISLDIHFIEFLK